MLHIVHGDWILDILEPISFQKYSICWVYLTYGFTVCLYFCNRMFDCKSIILKKDSMAIWVKILYSKSQGAEGWPYVLSELLPPA